MDHQELAESNHFLFMDPKDIPATRDGWLRSNLSRLLTDDIWHCANYGFWKNCNRGLGWGITSVDSRTFICLKRTFMFYRQRIPGKPIKTNWITDVYLSIDNKNNIKTGTYQCKVRQANNYDPRPQCTSHTPKAKDEEKLASTMAEFGKLLFDGYETSTEDGNYNANSGGTWSGFPSRRNGKRARSDAWGPFTQIEAHGPEGEALKMSICKRCCMVYRVSTASSPHGTNTLKKHYCRCGCNH